MKATVLFLAVCQLALQAGVWLPEHWNVLDQRRDVPVYYQAARDARNAHALYRAWPDFGPDKVPSRYFYPPPFAASLAPLGNLSFLQFSRAWCVLLLGAFWIYAWSLARLAGFRSVASILIAGLVLQLWPGANIAMSFGNVEPLLWAALGIGLTTRFGGVVLALAALLKIHPVWPLLALARRGGRHIIWPALATFSVGVALGAIVCGVHSYRDWAYAALPVVGQGTFDSNNLSVSFAVLRLARECGWNYVGGPLPPWARLYLALVAIAMPLFAGWVLRRRSARVQCAGMAVAAVLFSPLCWNMYLPILLCPLALVLRRALTRELKSPSPVP